MEPCDAIALEFDAIALEFELVELPSSDALRTRGYVVLVVVEKPSSTGTVL